MDDPVIAAARRRLDRVRASRDAGFSLSETLVGMTIMTVFMAIFSSAMISMFTATNKTTTINDTATQLNVAFARLDKQVRYASAISTEGQSGGSWYVEFLTTNTGSPFCSQLKLDPTSQVLQERTWTVPT
ncbi:MAG TPA: prepilin-type N-terminal cleavage/methylation domain-containing protein, partial [Jatrophihabitans sp.]|nr:prepilin-type N-terminal cleavage/methylation domain-containing protein [Jatrophihabitans sp.]